MTFGVSYLPIFLNTQIVTKLKNFNYDKTPKTQIVTKLKNTNCDKIQKLKLGQNLKTQVLTNQKLKGGATLQLI